jgi:hypothetical protein
LQELRLERARPLAIAVGDGRSPLVQEEGREATLVGREVAACRITHSPLALARGRSREEEEELLSWSASTMSASSTKSA